MLWTLIAPDAHAALELEGLIEPSMVIELSSPVVGVIESITVEKGQSVAKGDVIARLLSQSEEAQVALAKAKSQRTDLIRYQLFNSSFAQRKRKRFEQLAVSRSVAELDRDKAATEAQLAQMELVRAENDKAIAALELSRAEALVEEKRIRSPIDGLIVQRYLNPGESVKDKALVRIAQVNPLKIEVLAQASLRSTIRVGMSAEVIPEGANEVRYPAKVDLIDPVVDAASGSFGIRLRLENSDKNIVSGLRCRVRFSDQLTEIPTGSDAHSGPVRLGASEP